MPPPVDDSFLLFGDVAVLLAVAQAVALVHVVTSPTFPGWGSPVTVPKDLSQTYAEGARLGAALAHRRGAAGCHCDS